MNRVAGSLDWLALLVASFVTLGAGAVAGDPGQIVVIGADAVEPHVVDAALNEQITFVNRSGRAAHVELIGPAGEHHVFQVPGHIRAKFHRPGPHPFVVHFYRGQPAELHGFIRVNGDLSASPGAFECTGLTVEETCIER